MRTELHGISVKKQEIQNFQDHSLDELGVKLKQR